MIVPDSQTPMASIIMNCYNGDKYLEEAIDSIYAQTYSNWEVIFWDNASTDNSATIAKSYDDRVKYHLAPKTTSLGNARNLALKKTMGKYIAFLDCDDIWLPSMLYRQIKILESKKEYAMCYSGVLYIDEKGRSIRKSLPRARSGDVLKYQLKNYEITMQSALIRKDIAIAFDEYLEFSPDFNLMMHIVSQYKVFVIRDYLIKYRKTVNSLTHKKADRWWIEMKYTLDQIISKYPELKERYSSEYKHAYAKVCYYKARYSFLKNDGKEARSVLSKNKYVSLRYFLVYVLSLFGRRIWNNVHYIKGKI